MSEVLSTRDAQNVPQSSPISRAGRATVIYYTVEGLNSFATTLYFYYVFFFFQQQYQFGNRASLLCAALSGGVYVLGSWYGGRFGQKHGYVQSMYLGFAVMLGSLLMGAFVHAVPIQILVLAGWTIGMSFTWPALEASVSEDEPRATLPRAIGVYNLVWAGTAALAYFSGGAMLEKLGTDSMFLIPAGIHLLQIMLLACFIGRGTERMETQPSEEKTNDEWESGPELQTVFSATRAKAFLRMAWVANPFAYIAINSFIPMIPYVAKKLALSPMLAGFFCSLWLFARLLAFAALWLWTGWHYRFRWLVTAYLTMIGCFVVLLLAPNLWVLIVAQVAFGLAIGLIYYSSLFYSMDVGETKGEHGGLHEAAIGIGNCAGPALGATALHFFPTQAQSGTWSVSILLLTGLSVLLWMGKTSADPQINTDKNEPLKIGD